MRKNIIIVVLAALSLCACDIDRLPTTSMAGEEIQNDPADKLEALVNGMYAQLKVWSDPMHRLGEYAGDNIMIRGSSTDAFYEFISYSRTPNNYRLQNFWDYGYKAIAQASNIIKMIPESSDGFHVIPEDIRVPVIISAQGAVKITGHDFRAHISPHCR